MEKIRRNHEIRKVQDTIFDCVRLGLIPDDEALELSKMFQKYKVIE